MKIRTFGEVFSDAAQLYRQHAKALFSGVLLMGVLPLGIGLLLMLFSSTGLMGTAGVTFIAASGIVGVLSTFAGALCSSTYLYSFVLAYEKGEELTFSALMKGFWKRLRKVSIAFLFLAILSLPAILLFLLFMGVLESGFLGYTLLTNALSTFIVVLIALPVLYFFVVFVSFPYMHLREGMPMKEAVKACFRRILGQWWRMFFVLLVSMFIYAALTFYAQLPFVIVLLFKEFLVSEMSVPSSGQSGLFQSVFVYFLEFARYASAGLWLPILLLPALLEYYDITERTEALSIRKRLEELGERKKDVFENTGTYG